MIMRALAAVVASLSFALAQNRVNGQTGANNGTTPIAQDGNITIHYVTVGKAQNNFVVRDTRLTSTATTLTLRHSQIVSMRDPATLSPSSSTLPGTQSSKPPMVILAFRMRTSA